MPLPAYGLLIGTIVGFRPPRAGSPHGLLMVQPAAGHPPYRIAVNLASSGARPAQALQGLVADLGASKAGAWVKRLRELGPTPYFRQTSLEPGLPTLDYVRGGVIDPTKFPRDTTRSSSFAAAVAKAVAAASARGSTTLVAVFGTGTPLDRTTGTAPGTGFLGVDNVHMNQGSFHVVGGADNSRENGPHQDGGLVFFTAREATGFFVKFASQTIDTDERGRPNQTGVPELDATPPKVRARIMLPPARAAAKPRSSANPDATATTTVTGVSGFVFADQNPDDAKEAFRPDDDQETYKAPYVVQFSLGRTRGPVPKPRTYPRVDLAQVRGASKAGYSATDSGESIVFDIVGDSGAPSARKLPGEHSVTELMVRNAQAAPPAFLFHVGDVVYFYGEADYYYSQFYEPFRQYPAPIFAIPGNHDGITYGPDMVSLDAFQKAFCAEAPGRWQGAGGILRSTMTQPGVYFTLDAPLVSIIGLYSNCGESLGWLDDQQLLFLYQELVRLKALRQSEGRAVILAIHHVPRWFPGLRTPDPTSAAIDRACEQAGFWPDAVICGHAHLYQRVVRQDGGRDVPYLIIGAGGYGISANEVAARDYVATLDNRYARVLLEEGYVRATVSRPRTRGASATLRFEYHSVKQTTNEPDDVCVVDLATRRLAQ